MPLLANLETRLNEDAQARQEFYADPVAVLRRGGFRLQPDREHALCANLARQRAPSAPVSGASTASKSIVIEI